MFLQILYKSLWERKKRVGFTIIAVIMGAAIVSALYSVSLDIDSKVSMEFRKFGANLMIIPKSNSIDVSLGGFGLGTITEQNLIKESDLGKIKEIEFQKNVLGYAPFLYDIIKVSSLHNPAPQKAVVAGTWFYKNAPTPHDNNFITGVRKINTWWHVKGEWLDDEEEGKFCIVGNVAAAKLGIVPGDSITIASSGNSGNDNKYLVKGLLYSGGNEDNYIILNLKEAQNLSRKPGLVNTVQISALCTECPIDILAKNIEEMIPDVEGRTVKQMAGAEMNMLEKTQSMMFMITIAALLASGIATLTSMSASVIERQREIGLMKSLGAENYKVALIFFSEAFIIGVLGGIAGYILGILGADYIGQSVFDTKVSLNIIVLPVTTGISVFITLIAAVIPVVRASKVKPAIVLRGE